MLRGTLVRCAQEARKPMIRFPDRKSAQKVLIIRYFSSPLHAHTETSEPQPHPAAPESVQKDFSHFQEVLQSGPHFHPERLKSSTSAFSESSSSSGSDAKESSSGAQEVAEDLHDLPRRFWQTPSLLIEPKEIDAINSGGATLIQQ